MDEQRHSACDECRSRKLRCSGEVSICQRCHDEGLSCVYSPRKKMGRPRKRKKDGQDVEKSIPNPKTLDSRHTALTAADPTFSLPVTMSTDDGMLDSWLGMHPFSVPENTDFISDGAPVALWHGQVPQMPAACVPSTIIPTTIASNAGTCHCISVLTNVLQVVRPLTTFHFPVSVGHLRNSISNLSSAVNCTICPKERGTALQNVLLLNAALGSLTDRFAVLLSSLDEETQRLDRSGETKELKVADTADMQHHTGSVDCPAGLVIYLSGEKWGELAKASVRKLVHGPGECFISLLDDLETRQKQWHADPAMQEVRQGRDGIFSAKSDGHQAGGCLSNIAAIRECVDRLQV